MEVFGLAGDRNLTTLRQFIKSVSYPFPVIFDRDGLIGLPNSIFPETLPPTAVVLDRQGRLFKTPNPFDTTDDTIDAAR
jgi:hypothetical protein